MSASSAGSLAMIGLGVMGANLARNIESRGFKVSVFDRSTDKNDAFKNSFKGNFYFAKDLPDLISSMPAPRTLFAMVPAGAPVDSVINDLIPLISKGDTIVDGGNSFFKDTERREKFCLEHGINFLGVGVSGGEEGALHGPSIMPGGPKEGWARIQPVLDAISAKVDGESCTTYIGSGGAGHFVKMVHNGIEYGDMQLIAESYDLLKHLGGLQPESLATVYKKWNEGRLNSFLIDITASIFTKKDDQGGAGYLVDKILDKAGQKGTGKWTSQTALDAGIAIPTLAAAVDSRCMSALKTERVNAEKKLLSLHEAPTDIDVKNLESLIENALYSAKILAYAQGMRLIKECSDENKWGINLSDVAAIWRGGCIIRAKFLNEMRKAFKDESLPNLILDPAMNKALQEGIPALRKIVSLAVTTGIPVPALASAIGYYDQYRRATLPLNLTQAQRDFFGAHTYERNDKPGVFHTQWS
jgi:6-phosphogluconate dehydrogenase